LGIVVIAVPNNTGATTLCPLDPGQAWPPSRWTAPNVRPCIALRVSWGTSLLALLVAALTLETTAFLRLWRALPRASAIPPPTTGGPVAAPPPPPSISSTNSVVTSPPEAQPALARAAVRACALAAPLTTALLFGLSSVAASSPWNYSRYLISLL